MSLKITHVSISTKIMGMFITGALLIIMVMVLVVVGIYRARAKHMMVEKASAFTAVADATKSNQSIALQNESIPIGELLGAAQAKAESQNKELKDMYEETRVFSMIPVVSGWKAAEKAVEIENAGKDEGDKIHFKIVAFEARNKNNEPKEGTAEYELLKKIESGKHGDTAWMETTDEHGNGRIVYMRAIKLDTTCMVCHGDNAGESDPVGFPKEGWKVDDIHGAYAVSMPMEPVNSATYDFLIWGSVSALVPFVVVLILLAVALRFSVTLPVKRVMERSMAIAKGDISEPAIPTLFNDEIGGLTNSVNEMSESLRQVINEVGGASHTVQSASSQLTETSREISLAIQQMAEASSSVAHSSTDAAVSARDAQDDAVKGAQIVDASVSVMIELAEKVENAGSQVRILDEQSQMIEKVVSMIQDVADQTNLLALNAAIEAARAGEHGRGFAVVADQVRQLAERTMRATHEVVDVIAGIQVQTEKVANEMQEGVDMTRKGVESAENAGDALRRIVERSSEVTDMISTIAAAAEQQSSTSEEIAQSMERIASGDGSVNGATEMLSNEAQRLNNEVSRFKTQ